MADRLTLDRMAAVSARRREISRAVAAGYAAVGPLPIRVHWLRSVRAQLPRRCRPRVDAAQRLPDDGFFAGREP